MVDEHNQVEVIAKIVCRYCLANRKLFGARPYKVLFPTTQKIDKTYQFIYILGGRRRFAESKKSALLRAHLFTPYFFQIAAQGIELMCGSNRGTFMYWNGKGTRKAMGFEEIAEREHMIEKLLGAAWGPYPFVQYQVNITNIWNEISPYLER